jgi:arginase
LTESSSGGSHLRLIWPQWQGGGTPSVRELASEFPFAIARRGYAVGSTVLAAVLPPHDGPSAVVPVSMSNEGLEERDGIEAKTVILDQLAQALGVIAQHDPARITTLGGECSVSVAPFAALARPIRRRPRDLVDRLPSRRWHQSQRIFRVPRDGRLRASGSSRS